MRVVGAVTIALASAFLTIGLSGCSVLFSKEDPAPAPASDAALTADATDAALPSIPACAKLDPLRDDFMSNEMHYKWETAGVVTFSQGQGRAVFDSDSTVIGSSGFLTSVFEHDFRDSAFTVHVADVTAGETSAVQIYIQLLSEPGFGGPRVSMALVDGDFEFRQGDVVVATGDYQAERDLIWRIRESDDVIYFEAGPTEAEIQPLGQTSGVSDFSPSHVRASIGVQRLEGAGTTHVEFSGINLSAAPTNYCPASTLSDSFDGASLDPVWRRTDRLDANCRYLPDLGRMAISAGSTSPICALGTSRAFDLTNSELELRLPDGAIPAGYLTLRLERDAANYLQIQANPTTVTPLRRVEGQDLSKEGIDLSDVTRMRIRHDGADVIWEVDTVDETFLLEQQPTPFDLNGVRVEMNVKPPIGQVEVLIDGVNAD